MPRRKDHIMRWGVMVCASTLFAIEGYNYRFRGQSAAAISHRGVSNGNGVQNTIQSLEKTSRETGFNRNGSKPGWSICHDARCSLEAEFGKTPQFDSGRLQQCEH